VVYSTKKDTGYFKVNLTQDPEGHLQEVIAALETDETISSTKKIKPKPTPTPTPTTANLAKTDDDESVEVNLTDTRGGRGGRGRGRGGGRGGRGGGRGGRGRGGRGGNRNQSAFQPYGGGRGRGRGRGGGRNFGNGQGAPPGSYQFGDPSQQQPSRLATPDEAATIKAAQKNLADAKATLSSMGHIRLNQQGGQNGNPPYGPRGGNSNNFYRVNNYRSFYSKSPFLNIAVTSSESDDTIYHISDSVPTAIIDGGANRSMIKDTHLAKNITECNRTIRGFDGSAPPTTVTREGVVAGIQAVLNPNGHANLLAQRDIMKASQSAMIYVKDDLYIIDEEEVERYIQKKAKSNQIIDSIKAGSNGLFSIPIPHSFERNKYDQQILYNVIKYIYL